MTGVHADNVHQVSRAHRPAEFFHDLVNALEVSTHTDQTSEAAEVREQNAVDQEAGAVVDDNRGLTHFLGVGNGGGNSLLAGLLATNNLNQRHHVYRVEEVHAAEVFRALQRFGQVGDGDGRGVGGDDGVFSHLTFYFSQHGVLDLRVLDHRFNYQVNFLEVAVGHGRADGVQRLGHLLGLHAALGYTLAQQLGGFVQTQLDAFLTDVLHQDRRALDRRLVGDAATHDARAQYGGQIHVSRLLVVLLGLVLEHLIIQEQTYQAGSNRSLGQLGKTSGFHFQCFFTTMVGCFLNGLDGFNRRRVVRASLTCNETF